MNNEELNPTFDGSPHAINSTMAHISLRIKDCSTHDNFEARKTLICSYVNYLLDNDITSVKDMLINHFINYPFGYEFIYRPPSMVSCLAQCSTLSLKFKRVEDDNLNEKN